MSSDYIFGIHDFGGEELMLAAGRPGWVVFSEAIGHDPSDRSGKDYTSFSRQGLGVIVRLNNGFYPHGTLPRSRDFGNFARRCANFVAASQGCTHWVIGNEMNYALERANAPAIHNAASLGRDAAADPTQRGHPQRFSALQPTSQRDGMQGSADAGELITPEAYASCFRMCRAAIHRIARHQRDQVLVGAVAPWNNQTTYPGNPSGDWVRYFQDILLQLGPNGCDGVTLHTYTHGPEPTLILDSSKLQNFPQHHHHFQAYRDFMHAIPANMRHLSVYITETDQGGPWENDNRGWIQAAYAEIDRWNRQNDQKIQALILYRWPPFDRWHINGKDKVIDDFRSALRHDYRWRKTTAEQAGGWRPRPSFANSETPRPTGHTSATSGQRPAPARKNAQPPQGAYRVQWLKGKPPRPLVTGQRVTFPVTIRNIGSASWPVSGPQAVALSYHFFQSRQELPHPEGRPLLTPLPHEVAAGGIVTVEAQVVIPDTPGNYTLVLDLIRAGESWFQEMQSDVLTRWLSVNEPRHPPQDQEEQTAPPKDVPAEQYWPGTESAVETTPELTAGPGASRPQGPRIVDVTASLPQGDTPLARRTPQQVRQLVICHTAAPPGVPVQAIAQTHVEQGYPGIAYHFFVLESGEVLQVSALDEVVNAEMEWSLTGVNICLEGNFDGEEPPARQLTATAQLCAWILPRFRLTAQNVVGMNELLDTSSPGETFNAGPAWKRILHEQIVEFLTGSPPSTERSVPTESVGSEETASADRPPRVPKPPIEDVTTRLPRDPQRFFGRQPEDVEFIVVNHTAAPPVTPLQMIAEAFHRRLPGILYQFFIATNGALYQTQPLMQVVDGKIPYIARAINIGFAGEFNDNIPTQAQIEAGSRLIAWLLEEFPQLTLASIRGVNEFINHTSPGDQWLQGQRWKDILLNAVAAAAGTPPPPPPPDPLPDNRITQQEQPHTEHSDSVTRQTNALRRENERLRQEILKMRADPNRWQQVVRPSFRDISETLPQHPTLRYRLRQLDAITHVAVHHTALPSHVGPERIANVHVNEDLGRGKEAWPSIGYHFFIRAEGDILQTQPLEKEVYHVAGHNPYTLAVAFAGSFMNGFTPTPQQIYAGARLTAWLLQDLHIPISNVLGHQEFPDNHTVCPGTEWLSGKCWRNLLIEEIVRVQSGQGEMSLYHYLLFPSKDLLATALSEAGDYFEKFKPSAGTRVEDAIQARYVTLVGAGSVFSASDEKHLVDAGAAIDRLDDMDTSAIQKLQQLSAEGRRFHSLLELE